MWARDIREQVNRKRSGGKGGGGGVETTTYTYFGTFAVLLCEGELTGIKRIWLNSKLVYDISLEASQSTYDLSQRNATKLRIYIGSDIQGQDSLIAATEGTDNTPAFRGRAYIVFDDWLLTDYGNRFPAVSVEVVKDGYYDENGRLISSPTNAGAIAQDICQKVGFNLADLDTTEIDTIEVQGFWTNSNISARNAIGQLQQAFFIDAVESNGQLRFINQIRPTSPLNILTTDIASHEFGQDRPDNYTIIRTQEAEIPDEISVTYLDPDFAYQQASQNATRQVSPNKNKLDVNVSLVLTASEALAISRKVLYLAWAQRRLFQFNLPLRYIQLEPGDTASVEFFGESTLVYVTKVNIGGNFLLQCEAIPYEPSLLALSAVAVPPTVNISIPDYGDTTLYLLDTNLFEDSDSDYGLYIAPTGNADWRQGQVYVSRNGGSSYDLALNLITYSVTGDCTNTLSTASEFIRDLANTLTVVLERGELESISELDFMNGRNSALVGDEIIYFKSAVLTAPNTYELSELLRGRRGTEWAISNHTASEKFILISDYIERLEGDQTDLNNQRLYKGLSPGQTTDDVTAIPFTVTGNAMKPYAPCHIGGDRNGGGDLTINWIRRTRRGGSLVDYRDADLGEDVELYEVDVLDGASIVRTIYVSTTSASYTAAQQISDFGSTQATVDVVIFQLSDLVGRGYPATATI